MSFVLPWTGQGREGDGMARSRRLAHKVQILPTLVSLGNMLFGLASITYAVRSFAEPTKGPYLLYLAAMCVCFAMVCDLLDGRIARMTGSESAFGAEIDSLADIVSFGIAPAVLVVALIIPTPFPRRPGWILAAAYAAFAAMRLARYNVEKDEGPADRFTGLPSPAAAGAIVGVVLLHLELADPMSHLSGLSIAPWSRYIPLGLPIYALFIGLLMVSRVRYTHLGRVMLSGRKPFTYLVVFLLIAVLAGMQLAPTLAAGFTLYVFVGLALEAKVRLFGAKEEASAEAGPSAAAHAARLSSPKSDET
jgi:CDP-diacylglycerol--serine O-phosphatidyltransferase